MASAVFDYVLNLEIACALNRMKLLKEFWECQHQTRARKEEVVLNILKYEYHSQLYETLLTFRHFLTRNDKLVVLLNKVTRLYFISKSYIKTTLQLMIERSFNKGLSTKEEICEDIWNELLLRDERLNNAL